MPDFTDQTGRNVSFTANPSKIISLVPSLTELLSDLGLDAEVAGITKFCIHPSHWHTAKTIAGGTKNLDIGRIRSLQPDLILASKEENIKEQVEELAVSYPVWVSDIHNVSEAMQSITEIGKLTGRTDPANNLVSAINEQFSRLALHPHRPKVIYLIWREPYMTIGGDTFIHSMLDRAGFDNIYKDALRYPSVTLGEIAEKRPNYIFLSSEPYPFRERHAAEIRKEMPEAKIVLVDGEMFSWYGSRMLYAPSYFLNLWTYGLHGK
jgi:ABC-type Fe3+-hydroxamate transport system substrate-binding protein